MPNDNSAFRSEIRQFDPDNLTAAEVLKVITLALAKACGADPLARLKAEKVMNDQFSRGMERGLKQGGDDGYRLGYREGLADGKLEALDTRGREEAERVTIKAAARARKERPRHEKANDVTEIRKGGAQ